MFSIYDEFRLEHFRFTATTNRAAVLLIGHEFSIILPILANYTAFFYIIRKSYKIQKVDNFNTNNFSENDIQRFSTNPHNKDIDQFLT
jgi:hypothetical protein